MAPLLLLALLVAGCAPAATATAAAGPPSSVPVDAAGQVPSQLPSELPVEARPLPVVAAPQEPALPVTVTGADGVTSTVADASRILPLSGGVAEVVVGLGLGDRVVGRDEQATFAEVADLPVVTSAHSTSAEGVLSLAPTVVLADTTTGPPEALEAVRAAGIPVVVVDTAWTLSDIGPRITAVAEALGVPAAGEALVAMTDAAVAAAAVPWEGEPPTVAFLYLRGTAGVYLLGGDGSGADALLEAVGAVDAGSALGRGPFTPLTTEALVAAAPDALLVMTGGLDSVGGLDGLLELPGIAQTPAARDGAVVAVEDGLLLGFGARTPAVVELLAARLREVLA